MRSKSPSKYVYTYTIYYFCNNRVSDSGLPIHFFLLLSLTLLINLFAGDLPLTIYRAMCVCQSYKCISVISKNGKSYCSLIPAMYYIFLKDETARSNREYVHDGFTHWHYFQLLAHFRCTNSQARSNGIFSPLWGKKKNKNYHAVISKEITFYALRTLLFLLAFYTIYH